jgi:hypothetical protein
MSAGSFDALLRSDGSARLRFSRPSDADQLVVRLTPLEVARLVEFLGGLPPASDLVAVRLVGGPADISHEYQ